MHFVYDAISLTIIYSCTGVILLYYSTCTLSYSRASTRQKVMCGRSRSPCGRYWCSAATSRWRSWLTSRWLRTLTICTYPTASTGTWSRRPAARARCTRSWPSAGNAATRIGQSSRRYTCSCNEKTSVTCRQSYDVDRWTGDDRRIGDVHYYRQHNDDDHARSLLSSLSRYAVYRSFFPCSPPKLNT